MVVERSRGPSAAVLSAWPGSGDFALALAASGYFVLMPNPRGSFGQGEVLHPRQRARFWLWRSRDILSGGPMKRSTTAIDSNPSRITGWSYGGYMTMWAVTQTNRFKRPWPGGHRKLSELLR